MSCTMCPTVFSMQIIKGWGLRFTVKFGLVGLCNADFRNCLIDSRREKCCSHLSFLWYFVLTHTCTIQNDGQRTTAVKSHFGYWNFRFACTRLRNTGGDLRVYHNHTHKSSALKESNLTSEFFKNVLLNKFSTFWKINFRQLNFTTYAKEIVFAVNKHNVGIHQEGIKLWVYV